MKVNKVEYKISNKLSKKIVLISDIHYKNKLDIKRLNNVFDNIKKINPDYICIPGDITDRSDINDSNLLIEWFNKLSNLSKVIISIGNHEFYDKNKKFNKLNNKLLNEINNIDNVYLLNNKNIIIDKICFYGVTYMVDNLYKENCNNILDIYNNIKVNKKYYNILLVHSPINIIQNSIINKFDLILCGHTHGGVVPKIFRPIFKNNGLISPSKKIFPKNIYGKINNVIISSGLKVTPFKLINKLLYPEIVIINV